MTFEVEVASGGYIYQGAWQLGKYPMLAINTEVNSCLKPCHNITQNDDFLTRLLLQRLQYYRAQIPREFLGSEKQRLFGVLGSKLGRVFNAIHCFSTY